MDHTVVCKKCGKDTPPSKIRYFQDPKSMICIECVRKIKAAKEKKEEQPKPEYKKIRYICKKCKHVTTIKENFNKQCSFCGSFDVTKQEWNSDLDTLIKESGQRIYDN